jgi:hypothetical protein
MKNISKKCQKNANQQDENEVLKRCAFYEREWLIDFFKIVTVS